MYDIGSGSLAWGPPASEWSAFETPADNAWRSALRAGRRSNDVGGTFTSGNGARSEKMARLEAALFVADSALSARRLMQSATLADAAEVRGLISELNDAYEADGTAFRVQKVAAGFRLLTRPQYAKWLSRLHQRQAQLKLSPPSMESLAIVAYQQPVTRAEVEAVRGVQSAEMLKQLMERGLVKIVGEDDSLGRPYLYGTTRKFLELFGLSKLDDLPNAEELRRKRQEATKAEDPVESEAEVEDEADESEIEDDDFEDEY